MKYINKVLLWACITWSCSLANAQGQTHRDVTNDPGSDIGVRVQWCGVDSISKDGKSVSDESQVRVEVAPGSATLEKQNLTVRLISGSISCPPGVELTLLFINFNGTPHPSVPTRVKPAKPVSIKLSATGYFRADYYYYPREGYCIAEWTQEFVSVRVCGRWQDNFWIFPECNQQSPCVPKCCPTNKIVTFNKACEEPKPNSTLFKGPILYDSPYTKSKVSKPFYYFVNPQLGRLAIQQLVHERSGFPSMSKLCFRIRKDGVLLHRNMNHDWDEVPMDRYCVDGFQMDDSQGTAAGSYQGNENEIGIFLTMLPKQMEEASPMKKYHIILYGSTLLFSSVFLLLTLIVYVLLWKEQKLHGWTTMSHIVSMYFMYLILGTNYFLQLLPKPLNETKRNLLCVATGVFNHFFFLSNFCWLTVICFTLFWTFRGISVSNPHSRPIGQYLLYALFGWGVPFLVVTVSVLLDSWFSYEPCNTMLTPEYGLMSCYIADAARGPYLYYPIAVLLTLNLILFSITSWKLYEYKKSTSMATRNMDDHHQQLFRLISKLFFVMGFTWIFEFVSWWVSGSRMSWYWILLDVLNCFQAVAIFVIYVCKPAIIKSLRNKYPKLKPWLGFTNKFLGQGRNGQETELTTVFNTDGGTSRGKSFVRFLSRKSEKYRESNVIAAPDGNNSAEAYRTTTTE